MILECIETGACHQRPPAPWMKCPQNKALRMERDTARYVAYNNTTDATGNYFRSVRNKLKGAARKVFIEKAMCSNKLREVWKVPRILKPSPNPLRFDPDELNEHFSSLSQKTLDSAVTYPALNWLI